MKFITTLTFALLCAYPFAAGTAEPALTFDDCVREMIAANPQFSAARDNLEKSRMDVRGAYAPFLPQISANASASKSNTELDTGYSDSSSYNANISASQSLFEGFHDEATLRQFQALLASAESNFQQVKATLSASLTQSFVQTLYAQDLLKLTELIADRRKLNSDMIEMRFEAGRENKGSMLRIKAYHRQSLSDISQATRGIQVAQQQLAAVLGRFDAEGVSVTGRWDIAALSPPPDFLDLAKATPSYRIAAAQLKAAREGVRIAASDFYPSWSVSGMVGRQDDSSLIPNNDQWSISTTLSYPLFSGGQSYYALRGAQALRRASESQLTDAGDQAAANLKNQFAAWQNAIEQTEVQSDFLQAANLRAEIARSQYQNGLMSFQDWDTIENDLINTQKSMLASQRDAIIARATWEKTVGTGVIP